MKRWMLVVPAMALAGLMVAAGCSSDDEEPKQTPIGAGGSTQDGGAGSAGESQAGNGGNAGQGEAGQAGNGQAGNGEAGSAGQAGAAGQGQGGSAGNGEAGSAGAGGSGPSCSGVAASLQDVALKTIPVDTIVSFSGVVATTKKILISKSNNTGSCLWGAFVRDAAEPYATLIVNYGDKAPQEAEGYGECPTGTDLLPEDLAPGDKLDIVGKTSEYAPSNCTATKQVQVLACSINRTGTGAPPEPVVVQPADLTTGQLALQGLLVKIQDVTAENWPDGGTVGPYGVIKLQGSGLEVHDKFYYKQEGAPEFDDGQHFDSIVGVSHLDYCTWALQPRSRCTDFDPPSMGCSK